MATSTFKHRDVKDQPGFRTMAFICLVVLYAPILILMLGRSACFCHHRVIKL